jgi:hypothetical protein
VNFASQFSECPPGATCTQAWDFGDGQTAASAFQASVSHQYALPSSVCVGDATPGDQIKTGTCTRIEPLIPSAFEGTACDTSSNCFYTPTMTITDNLGYSDSSSMGVQAMEIVAPPAGVPTASVAVNTATNAVVLTVTAGAATVDSVYIDWMDATSTNNGTDILPGANRAYNHTYSLALRAEKLYKIRVKVRTKTPTGVYTYHYLTVNADVR